MIPVQWTVHRYGKGLKGKFDYPLRQNMIIIYVHQSHLCSDFCLFGAFESTSTTDENSNGNNNNKNYAFIQSM